MKEYDIIALMRCQRRTWQFEKGLEQTLSMPSQGIKVLSVLMPDRPTPEVQQLVDKYAGHSGVEVVNQTTVDGHRWAKTGMRGMNKTLDYLDAEGFRAPFIWFHDDDEVLASSWNVTLPQLLGTDYLAFNATSLYIWGKDAAGRDLVNLNQFHYSPIISRYRPGDRFPEDGRSLQTTEAVHRLITRNSFRAKTLPFYLLDYGATTQEEREAMVKRMNAAGKDDLYTRSFLAPPVLVPVTDILTSGIHPIEFAEMQARKKGLMKEC